MALCPIAAFQLSALIASAEQNSLSDPTQQQKTAPSQSSGDNGAHRIRILPVSDPIKINGRLDEPAWSQAEALPIFVRRVQRKARLRPRGRRCAYFMTARIFISASARLIPSRPGSTRVIWCGTRPSTQTIGSRSSSIPITISVTRFDLRSTRWARSRTR